MGARCFLKKHPKKGEGKKKNDFFLSLSPPFILKKMSRKTILTGCFLMAISSLLFSQQNDFHPCGTQDGKVDWLVRYQQNPQGYDRMVTDLFLPIKIHIVGNDEGSGYFNVGSVMKAFCGLNKDFLESGIQFFIKGDLHYIDNDNFYIHTFQQGNQMMQQNNVTNVINCYIVADPAGNCGYSRYNRGIALNKSCLGPNDHTWAHEVGHYLSLPHPFFGWEGTDNDFPYNVPAPNFVDGEAVEKMDGSNCHFAADGFCDTAPDYLAYRWPCNGDSLSTKVQTDPDSVTFRSDGTLFMSYALDQCSSRFSQEQIDAMHANVHDDRPYLKDQMDELNPIEEAELVVVAPEEGVTVDFFEEVYFEWEAMPNAEGYVVDLTRFEAFGVIERRYHVQGTSFISNDLKAGKTYYWRVWPYNAQYTCEIYSDTASFSTGVLSAVRDIEEVNGLQVVPNPVAVGSGLHLSLDASEAVFLDVELLTITGQSVGQFSWAANAGSNRQRLETNDLRPGIYFLQLKSEKGVLSRKVIVTND